MTAIRIILCLAIVIFLVVLAARTARADEVLAWNRVTLDTIRALRLTPPRAARTLAMVHVAIFDAVNGIERRYEPYHVDPRAPPGACLPAAAAMAAYTVLVGLHPERRADYDAALAGSLGWIPVGPSKNKGKAWGRRVGGAILRLRQNDGAGAIVPYVASDEVGQWRPTPPAFAPALLPQWPFVRPFAMYTGDQFRVEPPPPLASAAFTAAFHEVAALGRSDSEVRTGQQAEIAFFWEDGPGSVTPPGHWQVIAQELARRFRNDVLENARLFALLSIAQADAAISCWDSKYAYEHFRPITAITQDAGDDGNPATETDPTWAPLAAGRALGNFVFDNLLRPLERRPGRHHRRPCDGRSRAPGDRAATGRTRARPGPTPPWPGLTPGWPGP